MAEEIPPLGGEEGARWDRDSRRRLAWQRHQSYMNFARQLLWATLAIILSALWIHAVDLWYEHVDRQQQIAAQVARDNLPGAAGGVPIATHPNDAPGLQALEDSLRPPPGDISKTVPGPRRIPAQPLLDLVQSLLGLGRLTKETAGEIRSEITKEVIKGTGEIAVETAKKIIDRFFEPSKAPAAPTGPVQITLTGCGCGTCCTPRPPPPNLDNGPSCSDP